MRLLVAARPPTGMAVVWCRGGEIGERVAAAAATPKLWLLLLRSPFPPAASTTATPVGSGSPPWGGWGWGGSGSPPWGGWGWGGSGRLHQGRWLAAAQRRPVGSLAAECGRMTCLATTPQVLTPGRTVPLKPSCYTPSLFLPASLLPPPCLPL